MASIRPADAGDLPAITTLLQACGLPHQDLDAEKLHNFLVAVGMDRLHAVVGLERYGTVALLRSLAVDPAYRAAGLGSRLLAAGEALARQMGVRQLYLLTTTAPDYFAGRGYEAIPRERAPEIMRSTCQFSTLCPSQAICMHRAIS